MTVKCKLVCCACRGLEVATISWHASLTHSFPKLQFSEEPVFQIKTASDGFHNTSSEIVSSSRLFLLAKQCLGQVFRFSLLASNFIYIASQAMFFAIFVRDMMMKTRSRRSFADILFLQKYIPTQCFQHASASIVLHANRRQALKTAFLIRAMVQPMN